VQFFTALTSIVADVIHGLSSTTRRRAVPLRQPSLLHCLTATLFNSTILSCSVPPHRMGCMQHGSGCWASVKLACTRSQEQEGHNTKTCNETNWNGQQPYRRENTCRDVISRGAWRHRTHSKPVAPHYYVQESRMRTLATTLKVVRPVSQYSTRNSSVSIVPV